MRVTTINILCCLLAPALLFSCNISNPEKTMDALVPKSLETGNKYYASLEKDDVNQITHLFSKELYKLYDTADLKKLLAGLHDSYGTCKKAEFQGTRYVIWIKDNKKDRWIINTYKVSYSSGAVTKEDLKFMINEGRNSIEAIDAFSTDKY